jgi:histone deacetylase 1/2
MAEEIRALLKNNTWELTTFPTIKRVVGCEWVFFIKQKPNRSIDRYKASC